MSLWIKIVAVFAALALLIGAAHLYNESLVDAGKAEVRLEWGKKTMEQKEAFDTERKRLEKEKSALTARFNTERSARAALEGQLDKERADAIAKSDVAGVVCIDDRMRDVWNRGNRNSGDAGAGAAR